MSETNAGDVDEVLSDVDVLRYVRQKEHWPDTVSIQNECLNQSSEGEGHVRRS